MGMTETKINLNSEKLIKQTWNHDLQIDMQDNAQGETQYNKKR